MISKAELAKKAKISPATITRIENGMPCRLETQRRIVLALGHKRSDKNEVFGNDMESFINDNGGRRSGVDRREFEYSVYIPDQRSNKEKRKELDRRLKQRTSAN
jgi:hypothetical protein